MKRYLSVLLAVIFLTGLFPAGTRAEDKKLFPAAVVLSEGEKYGYIDDTGTFVIDPVYDYAYDFNDAGIAITADSVKSDVKYTGDVYTVRFIDRTGRTVSGPYETPIPSFRDGCAVVCDGAGSRVIDSTGKTVLKSSFVLGDYGDGLVTFQQQVDQSTLYGFMDLKGKIVIPAKYKYASPFIDGHAKVNLGDGNYAVIDKSGQILGKSDYFDFDLSKDGLYPYYDKSSEKCGYRHPDGSTAIEPVYEEAGEFRDGFAVVEVEAGEYEYRYALIDTSGSYVLKPEYSGISDLGQGLYAVSNNQYYSEVIHNYSPKAIFNSKGKQLTDYRYYSIGKFSGDYAVASDSTTTFFINKEGEIVEGLPRLEGIGTLEFIGDIVRAELDDGLMYLRKNGEIIWRKDETRPLGDGLKVKTKKFRSDYLTFIEYPELDGLLNKDIQAAVNGKLKKLFTEGAAYTGDEEYFDDYESGFSEHRNKDLLIVEESGYDYPIGAAHGMPVMEYYYINLKTGDFYGLKDLFKKDGKYLEKLTSIVRQQVNLNTRMNGDFVYFTDKPEVTVEQGFIIGEDSISIYYYPYDIAAYAFGFPEFEIPYGQLTDVINKNGAFWNSFDKKIVSHKIMDLSDAGKSVINSVSALMDTYEKQLVKAINSNNFNAVKGTLLEGSSLYNDQKKLVRDLYSRKVKEKLVNYEIYAVDYDYTDDTYKKNREYKVYVLEEIGVSYQGKPYENKKYSWCYTVNYDNKTRSYRLSSIKKW